MLIKLKNFLKRIISNAELRSYFIFGVLTTIVSFVSYFFFRMIFPDKESVPGFLSWIYTLTEVFGVNSNTTLPVILSWVVAVAFAYVTNRKYVFRSRARGFIKITRELSAFFGGRVLTLIVDMLIMFIFVDLPNVENRIIELIVKIAANTVVLILNYIISRIFVFKKT